MARVGTPSLSPSPSRVLTPCASVSSLGLGQAQHLPGGSATAAGGGVFIHARFGSLLWGFADDVFVQLSCSSSGSVVVEVQGQLRLGVGDMEVNVKRNVALMAALEGRGEAGGLAEGSC